MSRSSAGWRSAQLATSISQLPSPGGLPSTERGRNQSFRFHLEAERHTALIAGAGIVEILLRVDDRRDQITQKLRRVRAIDHTMIAR